ncbi:poly-beta-1,6-N-acetyl-D-glucosamine biosynthesis protein PgaD [Luteimonas fraxinea]|uniref:Poly-beta-1,6-N-acetyl-D-glucosamine biosynthesis protein PgaD n=1 Tax=Luteimonas fraxinea TaxID=2901869 RepID=A0ABS8UD12_9GAMM|nr:poly-beta-1,6-N-acetyl-D-glucosamine biosynthesis protein PgaD [Luteimonas fraxinea]MCD9096959.1 poly-beta-1,6-N-acetyl-D-glucosamine biosynthesis protein PgaD [Luteimonas fraxinea]MCD9126726.1 poly-beta-1,6-N-acetyl-D-glucosamine biosynthesis protein PgaD [Luteimonas fraxinea]UHH09700.1 poly-beta-1,6-N-acetyl-D-glucosamine biosynthesis protein PgaD [Luteimonas fraxinea]
MTPPIIDHTPARGPRKRLASGALTAAAWTVYAWLWVPLITAVAWFIGVRTAYLRLYLNENEIDAFLLLSLPVIALICGALLIGWAEYNRVRFSKADRRKRRVKTDEEQVRIALGASPLLAAKLRDGRIVRLALDDDARPVAATSGS